VTRDETESYLAGYIRYWKTHGFGRWAIVYKETGRLIGYGGIRMFLHMHELACLLAKDYWNMGLGTEAARACLRYGFEQLKFDRIFGITKLHNIAAQNLMVRLGMAYAQHVCYYGVDCVEHVMTREEFRPDDSVYILRDARGPMQAEMPRPEALGRHWRAPAQTLPAGFPFKPA
jgi:ribosomal-protein-alanine N-acetyltransferase